jgi:hypothetical protein
MDKENQQERFLDADALARALGETRRYVLYLARTGVIRSYPVGGRERIKRKFFLSQVRSDLVGRKRKIRRKRIEASGKSQTSKACKTKQH